MALLIDQMKIWQEIEIEREGGTRSKGTQARSRTRVRCREDKFVIYDSKCQLGTLGTHLYHFLKA